MKNTVVTEQKPVPANFTTKCSHFYDFERAELVCRVCAQTWEVQEALARDLAAEVDHYQPTPQYLFEKDRLGSSFEWFLKDIRGPKGRNGSQGKINRDVNKALQGKGAENISEEELHALQSKHNFLSPMGLSYYNNVEREKQEEFKVPDWMRQKIRDYIQNQPGWSKNSTLWQMRFEQSCRVALKLYKKELNRLFLEAENDEEYNRATKIVVRALDAGLQISG